MIPSILGFQVKEKNRMSFRLWFPVFLFWPILLAMTLLTAPVVFLVSCILWHEGKGKTVFTAYIAVHALLFGLSGLKIDIQAKDHTVFYINLI
jgi:hypothetical protein